MNENQCQTYSNWCAICGLLMNKRSHQTTVAIIKRIMHAVVAMTKRKESRLQFVVHTTTASGTAHSCLFCLSLLKSY